MLRSRYGVAAPGLCRQAALVAGALLFCVTTARSMDLLQAYQAAMHNDATILASRAAAEAGRERLPQAQAQLLPNVTASIARNRNRLSSTAPDFLGQEQTTDAGYPSSNQTLSLRQPLLRSYQMAQLRQAQAQVDDVNATLLQDEQDLAVRVSTAYFEALLSHEQLALVLAQRKTFTTQLDAARQSLAAGAGTRTDVDDAQARLDMTSAQEIEARQNIDYTLRKLQSLVNKPIDALATLDVSRLDLSVPPPDRLQGWIESAEQHNHQYQSLKAQVEVARSEVEKAQSGHYPTLDAVAQWSRSVSENVINVQSRHSNAALGLQLNVPLFAGGMVNSQVRQTLSGLERAEQVLEAGRRELALRVNREFRGITENIPKIRALEQALRSADQLVLSSRKSLQGGSRTLLDVMNAEQQRTLVLRDLAQARFMYLLSRIRLLALVGAANADALAEVNRMLRH